MEQSLFQVKILSVGSRRFQVAKLIRDFLGESLEWAAERVKRAPCDLGVFPEVRARELAEASVGLMELELSPADPPVEGDELEPSASPENSWVLIIDSYPRENQNALIECIRAISEFEMSFDEVQERLESEVSDFFINFCRINEVEQAFNQLRCKFDIGECVVGYAAPFVDIDPVESSVILSEYPKSKKFDIIRIIRRNMGLSIKESKYLVDSAPTEIFRGYRYEVEQVLYELSQLGAKLNVKEIQ